MCCRDGAPYCEKDYQGLFGVKCEACHQFITGKVLEVSDTRDAFEATIVFLRGRQNHKRGSSTVLFCFFLSSLPVEERKYWELTDLFAI